MGKYYSRSTSEQTDESINIGEATTVVASGSVLTEPGSFNIAADAHVGDVTYNQFPAEVRASLTDMVEVVEATVSESGKTQRAATQAVSAALRTQTTGESVVFVDLAKYGVLGIVALLIGKAVLKR